MFRNMPGKNQRQQEKAKRGHQNSFASNNHGYIKQINIKLHIKDLFMTFPFNQYIMSSFQNKKQKTMHTKREQTQSEETDKYQN